MKEEQKSGSPCVFSIPPGIPFLEGLALGLNTGKLAPHFFSRFDPLALASVTIYLPTRRAARKLESLILETGGGNATLLPKIKVLGEFDEEDIDLSEIENIESQYIQGVPSLPMPLMDRLLILASLVRKWKENLPAYLENRFNEKIVIFSSTSETIWIARDLARLMDEVDLKGADWNALEDLENYDFAGWEQILLDFLLIVTKHWPEIAEERGQCGVGAWSKAATCSHILHLQKDPPAGLIIAAGSTGSLPATAELLTTIARLPNGVLVLPGLDRRLDKKTWQMISNSTDEELFFTHPQYRLAKLLSKIEMNREDVEDLFVPDQILTDRSDLISETLRPVETTDKWFVNRKSFTEERVIAALNDVCLIEATNEREEAAAIALALRYAIDTPGKTAALVTPDRVLAKRVSAELKSFGIIANDSGGLLLSDTLPGSLLRLLAKTLFQPSDSVTILSFLKHPLTRLGMTPDEKEEAIRLIELIALRGGTGRPDILSLSSFYEKQKAIRLEKRKKAALFSLMQNEKSNKIVYSWLTRLEEIVAPFEIIRQQKKVYLSEVVRVMATCLEEISKESSAKGSTVYRGEAGKKLYEFLENILNAKEKFLFLSEECPEVLNALMSGEAVRPENSNQRISIWGVLESRLQGADVLILGGLNENSWPRKPKGECLMSRAMRKKINLNPPEWRIGLAAHDFEMAMGAAQVIMSRSLRAGETPTTASRWLQRLMAFVGPEETKKLKKRGEVFIRWAYSRDSVEKISLTRPPEPCPPLNLRPRSFSLSEIETLIRDPYAIYAKKILGLIPLDPLIRDPGAAERGTLFHEIIHQFTHLNIDPGSEEALEVLMNCARKCFDQEKLPEDVYVIWFSRFEKIAVEFLKLEKRREPNIQKKYSEVYGKQTSIGSFDISLSVRADRVDLLNSGGADIIDYKTGTSPLIAQARKLLSPQLALEAAMLKRGAFSEIGAREPENLFFIRLKEDGKVVEENLFGSRKEDKTICDLAEEAWGKLERMMAYYNDPASCYRSRARPFREKEMNGDYDHLARALEWSIS